MGFAKGSVSFRTFAVVGAAPAMPDQATLDAIASHRIDAEAPPEEIVYGWAGGRHLFDDAVTFAENVFEDCIVFAMRVDTNRVPGGVVKAWHAEEEARLAADNASGFVSKLQKAEAKETVARKIEDAIRGGTYRRTSIVPVVWDMAAGRVYSNARGANAERLAELFERTFKAGLATITAGSLAGNYADAHGLARQLDDARPTRFAIGVEGEAFHPEYPWVAKGADSRAYLGNEFLLWLWHHADAKTGVIQTERNTVTVYLDRSLALECAYGHTGRDVIQGDGPSQSGEAREALRLGKVPRKAGMIIDANRDQFSFTLDPENLAYAGLKLPEIDDAESPRVETQERLALIRDFVGAVEGLYQTFLAWRLSSDWSATANSIERWAAQGGKRGAA